MADIHFGTDGWRAIIGEGFTNDNLVRVIDASARIFKEDVLAAGRTEDNLGTIIIGHDCRQNAHAYAQLAAEVAASHGFTVKLIGEKTNGKNVGMEVSKFTVGNYSYELAPISFQGYNAKQVTVDKNGLAVDTACEEWDGELKDYGDRSEPMLAAALSQITGQRSASVSGTRSTAPGVRPATDIALPDLSNRPNGMIVFLPAAEE